MVIGAAFYYGYEQAQVQEEIANILPNPRVLEVYKETQMSIPFTQNPYAGIVAAINISTTRVDSMSICSDNVQALNPLSLKIVHKQKFDSKKLAQSYLEKKIIKIEVKEHPIANSVAFVFYTKPGNTKTFVDLFLYEDGIWKFQANNIPADNYDHAVQELAKIGLVIKDYQLVDYRQFQKYIEQKLVTEANQ